MTLLPSIVIFVYLFIHGWKHVLRVRHYHHHRNLSERSKKKQPSSWLGRKIFPHINIFSLYFCLTVVHVPLFRELLLIHQFFFYYCLWIQKIHRIEDENTQFYANGLLAFLWLFVRWVRYKKDKRLKFRDFLQSLQ